MAPVAAATDGAQRATAIGFVSAFSRLPVHPANRKANSRTTILIRAIPFCQVSKQGYAAKGMLSPELAAGNMIRAKQGKRHITPYVWVHPDRAATDFFLKTEMDHENLESHKSYTSALAKLASVVGTNGEMPSSFAGSDEYWAIRDYLNLHELMAVGILKNVFDDHVCHDFWAGELQRAYQGAMPLINYVQSQPGQKGTYTEMIKVARDWEDKRKRGVY